MDKFLQKLPNAGLINEIDVFRRGLYLSHNQLEYIKKFRGKIDLSGCKLILVAGVSTAGKDTLVDKVLERNTDFKSIPRSTSRPPREGEIDGQDYFFNFKESVFWSEYGGNYYGLTWQAVKLLKEVRRGVMIQGLVYFEFIKELLESLGARVYFAYVLPVKESDGLDKAIKLVRSRLPIRHNAVMHLRLESIERELKYVFSNKYDLVKRGYNIIENYPVAEGFNKSAMEDLFKLFV